MTYPLTELDPEAVCCSALTCHSAALNGSLCERRGERNHKKETVVDSERQMGQYMEWVCGDLINWLV